MRLPVVKILWGMFAFPAMYPAQTLRAAGLPLLGIIAITLYWATGAPVAVMGMPWLLVIANAAFFSWLAVRCHRVVLLGTTSDVLGSRLKCVGSYFIALVVGVLASVFLTMVFANLFLLPTARYVPAGAEPADPADMSHIFAGTLYAGWLVGAYLLARLAPVLPSLALGNRWDLRGAWRMSRGNGWRLTIVVFLLPALCGWLIDLAYGPLHDSVAIAALAIVKAFLSAESVIALSLAYRELTATPAPPPTAPPA